MTRGAGILVAVLAVGACGGGSPTGAAAPIPPQPVDPLAGFSMSGSADSQAGATWTYIAEVDGVRYDLQGILLKPPGSGPFPAVIISHGAGGNALGYSRALARQMVQWGAVCVATNYTHSAGVPIGSPGTASEPGASTANVLRAAKLVDLLNGLRYVDMSRIALHGHSMGAFVTAATAGAHPARFRVASHTAGGTRPTASSGAAPDVQQVRNIHIPYQMHHGDADPVVPIAMARLMAETLASTGVIYELAVYAGADHDDVSNNSEVLERIRAWFVRHGLF